MDDQTSYSRETLGTALSELRDTVAQACARSERDPRDVTVVAVSKTHPPQAIKVLYDLGVRDFGESYVPELLEKAQSLPADIRWHFVGRLQSNKARLVGDDVVLVHSLDRKSLAKQLHRRAESVDVLLQVNVAGESTKGGVEPEGLPDLMDVVAGYSNLRVRGIMGMPPYVDDPEENRPHFQHLRALLEELRAHSQTHYPERAPLLEHLSMGMSNDYAVAIEEGATIVRVGTSLFGERHVDDEGEH